MKKKVLEEKIKIAINEIKVDSFLTERFRARILRKKIFNNEIMEMSNLYSRVNLLNKEEENKLYSLLSNFYAK